MWTNPSSWTELQKMVFCRIVQRYSVIAISITNASRANLSNERGAKQQTCSLHRCFCTPCHVLCHLNATLVSLCFCMHIVQEVQKYKTRRQNAFTVRKIAAWTVIVHLVLVEREHVGES